MPKTLSTIALPHTHGGTATVVVPDGATIIGVSSPNASTPVLLIEQDQHAGWSGATRHVATVAPGMPIPEHARLLGTILIGVGMFAVAAVYELDQPADVPVGAL